MTKKLVKFLNRDQLTGEFVSENSTEIVLDIKHGRLTIDKTKVESCESIFDCTLSDVGQYINTPDGVYVKIAENQFRLISGPYTSPVDVSSIQEGQNTTHEEVFAVENPIEPLAETTE